MDEHNLESDVPQKLFFVALYMLCFVLCSFVAGSVTDRPPGPPNSGRKGELRSAVCRVRMCMNGFSSRTRKKEEFLFVFFRTDLCDVRTVLVQRREEHDWRFEL